MADDGPIGVDPMSGYAREITFFRTATDQELADHIEADRRRDAMRADLQRELERREKAIVNLLTPQAVPPVYSFCDRHESEVGNLRRGQGGAAICGDCAASIAQERGLA
jgi:ClpX C4-type zinc finger protein